MVGFVSAMVEVMGCEGILAVDVPPSWVEAEAGMTGWSEDVVEAVDWIEAAD